MKRIIIALSLLTTSTISAQESWLTRIDDSTHVSCLSIPGTHDSATGNGIYPSIGIGITQCKSIEEQWNSGIRAFDLRPDINGKDSICIYHGPLKTRISFKEAISTIIAKLDDELGEFAIVIMRQERHSGNDEKRRKWSNIIGEYINSLGDKAAYFHPQLTVKELRGKILFLSRDHYSDCKRGAYISGWSHSPQGTYNASITSYCNGEIATLSVQDYYSPTTAEEQQEKLSSVIAHIEHSSESSYDEWSINHFSGYSSTLWGIDGIVTERGYMRNAEYIHNNVGGTLEKRKNIGIIMIDFAGCEKRDGHSIKGKSIIEAIIDNNF
ncbi:MAG: phosphatidylinositol-specific phospholipase C domain-containing protein [Bacteroidaceae bacterium]|nr:phosphatidylinositol-specific phospholipase C domain-containing protein [Bacteroidaceae bacterium]